MVTNIFSYSLGEKILRLSVDNVEWVEDVSCINLVSEDGEPSVEFMIMGSAGIKSIFKLLFKDIVSYEKSERGIVIEYLSSCKDEMGIKGTMRGVILEEL